MFCSMSGVSNHPLISSIHPGPHTKNFDNVVRQPDCRRNQLVAVPRERAARCPSGKIRKIARSIRLAGALAGFAISSVACHAATTARCIAAFEAYRAERVAAGVAAKHLPFLIRGSADHADTTVLLIHGLYESPYFLQGVASRFRDAGYNVVSLLLPGHWEAQWRGIGTVTYRDWLEVTDRGVGIARCLGPHVIVAGHSLGGTLALYAALKYPGDVDALVLWAPATELRALPTLGGVVGKAFGVSANAFTHEQADGDESAKIAGNPVFQLYELIRYLGRTYGDPISPESGPRRDLPPSYVSLGAYVRVPVFAIVPERDPAIDWRETLRLLSQMPDLKGLIVYPSNSEVWHANIAKSAVDVYRSRPNGYNPSFDWMMEQVLDFTARTVPAGAGIGTRR
jgi:pimeloyl-ACP methyl ester carboxylesterase